MLYLMLAHAASFAVDPNKTPSPGSPVDGAPHRVTNQSGACGPRPWTQVQPTTATPHRRRSLKAILSMLLRIKRRAIVDPTLGKGLERTGHVKKGMRTGAAIRTCPLLAVSSIDTLVDLGVLEQRDAKGFGYAHDAADRPPGGAAHLPPGSTRPLNNRFLPVRHTRGIRFTSQFAPPFRRLLGLPRRRVVSRSPPRARPARPARADGRQPRATGRAC